MKFNNTTIILIIILLLIIYLFDNIKELEDKLLSSPYVENIFISENYSPRSKYFKELRLIPPKTKVKPSVKAPPIKPSVKAPPIKKHVNILPAVLPLHVGAESGIKPENEVKVQSMDKFITGASAPGLTTMSLNVSKVEKPLFLNMNHYNV